MFHNSPFKWQEPVICRLVVMRFFFFPVNGNTCLCFYLCKRCSNSEANACVLHITSGIVALCPYGNFPASAGLFANLRLCENQHLGLVLPCLLHVYQKAPQWEIVPGFLRK